VLIYLDPDTVIQVARRLVDSLSADGWLLLGASDPPLAGRIPCEAVVTEAGLAYRRPARRASGWPVVERSAAPVERARPASGDGEPERSARPTRALDGPGPGPLERRPDRAPPADPAEAAACYAARDYARAAELASAVLERDGGEPHLWALGVRALANQGRLAEAGRLCSAALDRHRVSAELMCLHSTLLAAAGHHAEAAAAARRAVYLDRVMAMAHVALGSALSSRGERAGAGRALRCAERLLLALSATEPVPGSDGEPAGSLLEMVRLKLKLLGTAA
jgi:hypothetical protein